MIDCPNDQEILASGADLSSPGGTWNYQVIGPVCRLYDREDLPWPSCSLGWRGKQPSWRRIGCRFVADMGCRRAPSYAVSDGKDTRIITLYHRPLSTAMRNWWITPRSESVNKFWTNSEQFDVRYGKIGEIEILENLRS